MHKAVKLIITGKVQGVNFRYSTMVQAKALHLAGWVKNADNGSVIAFAEGKEEDVKAFISWCGRGPEHAKVTGVHQEETAPGNLKEFTILR